MVIGFFFQQFGFQFIVDGREVVIFPQDAVGNFLFAETLFPNLFGKGNNADHTFFVGGETM